MPEAPIAQQDVLVRVGNAHKPLRAGDPIPPDLVDAYNQAIAASEKPSK